MSAPRKINKLDADPDARSLRWGWIAFAVWTVFGGVLLAQSLLAGDEAAIGIAFVAPLWAGWLLWLLWRGLVNARHWAAHRAYGQWHGNYFEFDGQQLRVVFDDDDVYIAAADVFDALGTDKRGRETERVRLIAGADALIDLTDQRLIAFTENGLRAWMQRRTEPTATKFMAWLDNEVIAPYRTRRRKQSAQPGEGGQVR